MTALSSISLIALYVVFNIENTNLKNKITEVVKSDLVAYGNKIQQQLVTTAKDIFLIEDLLLSTESLVLHDTGTEFKSDKLMKRIGNNFVHWLNNRNIYDQIRVLDNAGQELLRVNYNNAKPYVVKKDELQNKGNRYYFTNAIELDDDTLYMSKLDLNVEAGKIELVDGHAKPMIRISSPLFDHNGQQLGLLILNYLAVDLFNFKHSAEHSAYTHFEVLNDQGFYVHAVNKAIEFGFMYDEMQNEVFSKYHDYDIFNNTLNNVFQKQFNGEIYSSLRITENSLATLITESIQKPISVASDSGDWLIFGEVEYDETFEFKSLARIYIVLAVFLLFISLVISKLLDELEHSREKRLHALKFNSTHDALTLLPNRRYMFESIKYKLSRQHPLAVLFLDLDGFKLVNDKFGHDVGDMALIETAERLKNNIRRDDLVARIGGDEFLVLLNDVNDKKIILRICKDILNDFSKEFVLNGKRCSMGISIGIALGGDSLSTESIIKNADNAMYQVKHNCKNNFCFFDDIQLSPVEPLKVETSPQL